MKYPDVPTILSAQRREMELDYSESKAARLKSADPTFVPSNNDKLNAIVKAIGVTVLVDVPREEDNTYETFPYTNTKTGQIHLPHPDSFTTPEMYAHTIAHELGHLTGKKMQRPASGGFTMFDQLYTNKYSDEELVAEMTAMGLEIATTGKLAAEAQSLSYLQSYLMTDQEGKGANARWEWAVAEADKAVSYLLGFIEG